METDRTRAGAFVRYIGGEKSERDRSIFPLIQSQKIGSRARKVSAPVSCTKKS